MLILAGLTHVAVIRSWVQRCLGSARGNGMTVLLSSRWLDWTSSQYSGLKDSKRQKQKLQRICFRNLHKVTTASFY